MYPKYQEFLNAVAALRRGMFPNPEMRPAVTIVSPCGSRETKITVQSGEDFFTLHTVPVVPCEHMAPNPFKDMLREFNKADFDPLVMKVRAEIEKAQAHIRKSIEEQQSTVNFYEFTTANGVRGTGRWAKANEEEEKENSNLQGTPLADMRAFQEKTRDLSEPFECFHLTIIDGVCATCKKPV